MSERLERINLFRNYLKTVEECMREVAELLLEMELEEQEAIAMKEAEDPRTDKVEAFFDDIYNMCGLKRKGKEK